MSDSRHLAKLLLAGEPVTGEMLAEVVLRETANEARYISMLQMARDKLRFEANNPGGFAASIDAVIEDAKA